MQIKIINNSSSAIPCPGEVSCAAGATKTLTGRTIAELTQFQQAYASGTVLIEATLEGDDMVPLVCTMKNPGDATGGATTKAACGFDLETEDGTAANAAPEMYLGVFDDAALTTPAANATLDTAAAGTIDAGAGTNLLEVTPSAAGEVSVTITNAVDETVYIKAWPKTSVDRAVDCSGVDSVTFSA